MTTTQIIILAKRRAQARALLAKDRALCAEVVALLTQGEAQ